MRGEAGDRCPGGVSGGTLTVTARVVVGADGAFSRVRTALGIPARLHRYPDEYLITILEGADDLAEARYFVGRRTILGVFPAAAGMAYLFDMIPTGSLPEVRARGIGALRDRWRTIDPALGRVLPNLKDWSQTACMPTGLVRARTWVADGAVLLGDAAHAMNPHASQGRMQAMLDAMALAELLPRCLEGDCTAAALAAFERQRRPQVEMLQRLADEQVLFWNTGNPILAALRDRVFRTLDRNPRLRYRTLAVTAGLRSTPPFGVLDRLMAAGLLPDPHAQNMSDW